VASACWVDISDRNKWSNKLRADKEMQEGHSTIPSITFSILASTRIILQQQLQQQL